MKIVVYNKKGGVGKTPLSFLIAKELGYTILTNDDSILVNNQNDIVKYQEEIDLYEQDDVVIDLGGWVTQTTIDVLQASDVILIPFNSKINSLVRTKSLTEELDELGIPYNLILTQYVSPREIEDAKQYFNNIDYAIKQTKMFEIMMTQNLSLNECLNKSPLFVTYFKNHAQECQKLIDDLRG